MTRDRKLRGVDSHHSEPGLELETHAQQKAVAIPSRSGVEVESERGVVAKTGNGVMVKSGNGVTTQSVNGVLAKSEDEVEAESGCGWHFCFSGSCVSHTRTAKWLLFWLCCAGFTLSMMNNGFMNVNVTTIEKRYQLKSRNSGLIISSWDIGAVSLVALLSYIGSRPGTSKPRLLGLSVLIVGLGCYVAMLPHFLVSPYETPRTNDSDPEDSNLCRLKSPLQPSDSESLIEEADITLPETVDVSNFLYLFIFASYIMGLCSSPVFPVGASFIDESVSPEKSAFYLGIFMTSGTVGPSIAFVLGGQLLKVFIDAPGVDPAEYGLTPSSDRWLGAWWIAYGITGTLAILIGLNILMIPRVIPRKQLPQAGEAALSVTNADQPTTATDPALVVAAPLRHNPYHHLKEFVRTSQALICNATFVFLSLAKAGETFLFTGVVPFMAKFMETQFGVSAGLAGMSMGAIGLFGGAVGTLMGGWFIKRFKMSCKSVLRFCFFISLSSSLSCAAFLTRCPNQSFAGVTTSYPSFDVLKSPNITSSCNEGCSCSDVPFSPVCGANSVIYFSPCHAGCTQSTKHNDQEIYSKCTCVELFPASEKVSSVLREELLSDQATPNTCPSDCSYLPLFIFATAIVMFATFFISMPNINGTLRCVESENRGLALGLQAISFRVLGSIPGPLLFGVSIDQACTLWGDTCGVQGACVAYDNATLSRYMFAICFTAKLISTVSFFLAWRKYASVETLKVELNGDVASISASVDRWPKTDRSKGADNGYENPALDVT